MNAPRQKRIVLQSPRCRLIEKGSWQVFWLSSLRCLLPTPSNISGAVVSSCVMAPIAFCELYSNGFAQDLHLIPS